MTSPVLIVIGPSASGKSSAVRTLATRGVVRVHPTWTTRPRRADELEGALEHRFVTDAVFDELDGVDFFLGTVTLPGLPYRYALPRLVRRDDGLIDTIMARAPFVDLLRPHVEDQLVYQVEDTEPRARQRLIERGCDDAEIEARIIGHAQEIEWGREIAQRAFVNDASLDALVNALSLALAVDVARLQVAQ